MAKSYHQKAVEAFIYKNGQMISNSPIIKSKEIRHLRASLILGKALDTISGLGFNISANFDSHEGDYILKFIKEYDPDLKKIIYGCCNLKVAITDTLNACGVNDYTIQKEVDLNKFDPNV